MQALRSIDTDDDGRISAEEAQAHRERAFSALDADSDRNLSRQEARAVAVPPGYIVITRMIPVVVAAEAPAEVLAQMDQDQNRQISRQEYMQYGEQRSRRRRSRRVGN